jgi:hypothetical protein
MYHALRKKYWHYDATVCAVCQQASANLTVYVAILSDNGDRIANKFLKAVLVFHILLKRQGGLLCLTLKLLREHVRFNYQ